MMSLSGSLSDMSDGRVSVRTIGHDTTCPMAVRRAFGRPFAPVPVSLQPAASGHPFPMYSAKRTSCGPRPKKVLLKIPTHKNFPRN